MGRGAASSLTSGQMALTCLPLGEGLGTLGRTGKGCRPSPREGRVGSPWGVLRGRQATGTSCATLRSTGHSGGQKEELCPTKQTLFSCAPQGQLLSEEAAESQGKQRRAIPAGVRTGCGHLLPHPHPHPRYQS